MVVYSMGLGCISAYIWDAEFGVLILWWSCVNTYFIFKIEANSQPEFRGVASTNIHVLTWA